MPLRTLKMIHGQVSYSYQSDERSSADAVKNLSENEEVLVHRQPLGRVLQRQGVIEVDRSEVVVDAQVRRRACRVDDDGVRAEVGSGDEVRKAKEERAQTHHDEAGRDVLWFGGPR